MNICFITSGHDPLDDRIFYHMAKTLHSHNNKVGIISSKSNQNEVVEGIEIKCFLGDDLSKRNKIAQFRLRMEAFNPDVLVCSEPLTVLASRNYSKRQNRKVRIIYDITEWYPSKKNLRGYKFPERWLLFIKLLAFNVWVSRFADSFIFGDYYKSKPYRLLHPLKPFIFIPYFPKQEYIPASGPHLRKHKLSLSYSGKISLEKGYGNFFNVLHKLAESRKDLHIDLTIIGWYETIRDRTECESLFSPVSENVTLHLFEKQGFKSFVELIKDTDIFIDLRSDDFENQRSVPIKLFYYAALGRPVIMSDFKSIRKEIEIENFGFLVNPGDSDNIVKIISAYLDNEKLYYLHCSEAKRFADFKYKWDVIEAEFINFLSLP